MYLSAYVNEEFTTIKQLSSDLYSLKQYILHSPIGTQFITSDNPGFTIVKNKLLNLGGFGDAFTFYFPLSPTTCLFLKWNDRENRENLEKSIYSTLIEKSEVMKINKFTKEISDKYILARDRGVLDRI